MIDEVLFGEKFQESPVSSSHREIVRETENDRKEELVIKAHRCVSGLLRLGLKYTGTMFHTDRIIRYRDILWVKSPDHGPANKKSKQSKSPQMDNILSVNDNRTIID
ncbi:unnamed protein product [Caenorhabditis sp. 36 PRJEB53466]|nr:unnamed protein product [Caenorhabditis sp. 36 PRJEB53466]